MRRPARNALMDRAHRGFVLGCIGLTAYGSYLLSLRVYRYFTVLAPAKTAYQAELLQKADKEKERPVLSTLDQAPELKL